MKHKSEYLQEDYAMLVCYGKSFDEYDDDCIECDMNSDCETLSALNRGSKVKKKYTGMPAVKPVFVKEEKEKEEFRWRSSPQNGGAVQAPIYWSQPYTHEPTPQQNPYYPQPGLNCNASIVPHPAPHLTYMQSNPIDCPMPMADEKWQRRVAKNVLSGILSETGRQVFEFFRRFRF